MRWRKVLLSVLVPVLCRSAWAADGPTYLEKAIQDAGLKDIFAIAPLKGLDSQAASPGSTEDVSVNVTLAPAPQPLADLDPDNRIILGSIDVTDRLAENLLPPSVDLSAGDIEHQFISLAGKSVYEPTCIVVSLHRTGQRLIIAIHAQPYGALPAEICQEDTLAEIPLHADKPSALAMTQTH